jgi:hypothetical protein
VIKWKWSCGQSSACSDRAHAKQAITVVGAGRCSTMDAEYWTARSAHEHKGVIFLPTKHSDADGEKMWLQSDSVETCPNASCAKDCEGLGVDIGRGGYSIAIIGYCVDTASRYSVLGRQKSLDESGWTRKSTTIHPPIHGSSVHLRVGYYVLSSTPYLGRFGSTRGV